jgi:hypothetical protein
MVHVVVCRTEGCGNVDVEIPLEVDPEAPPDAYVCGVCGRPITEVRSAG